VCSVFREGRKSAGRSRIVKVCFKERQVSERREFLFRGTQVLRQDQANLDQGFKPFVRRDMTSKEREQDFQLRQELKRRRVDEPDLVIRKGQIVSKNHFGRASVAIPASENDQAPVEHA
jgi:hypothetical protein